MATVTDLSGSDNSINDNTSARVGADSNVNVFEFGNLILADILPTILWLINMLVDLDGTSVSGADCAGSTLTEVDTYVSNVTDYDFDEYDYDNTAINYGGYGLQGSMMDMSGS